MILNWSHTGSKLVKTKTLCILSPQNETNCSQSRFISWKSWKSFTHQTETTYWSRKETVEQFFLFKTFIWSNSLECNSQWSESETTEMDESGSWPWSQSTNNTFSHLRPHCFSIFLTFLSYFFWMRESKNTEAVLKIKLFFLVIQRKQQRKTMARTSVTVQKHKVILYQVNKTVTLQRDAYKLFQEWKTSLYIVHFRIIPFSSETLLKRSNDNTDSSSFSLFINQHHKQSFLF